MNTPTTNFRNGGFSMIEVLVTLIILLFGLLGLAGLQIRAQQAELESYQRSQALILLSDMAGRIAANRRAAACYAIGTNFVGNNAAGTAVVDPANCAGAGNAETRATADSDLLEWSNLLFGSSESYTAGGATVSVGAMIGARGCIAFAADATGGVYTVSIVWQGLSNTVAPAVADTCGQNLYGNEARRRLIKTTVKIPTLT